jgi:hypothetical protein
MSDEGIVGVPQVEPVSGPKHSVTISTESVPGSGIKPGIYTTEFWATVATVAGAAVATFGPDSSTLSGSVHDGVLAVGGVVVAVYIAFRSILKIKAGAK